MLIEIESFFSPRLLSEFKDSPDGASVRVLPVEMQRDIDHVPIATIIIDLTRDVAIGFFVNWLFQKFQRNPPKKITIRRREITWDKGEITRAIEEEFKQED